MKYLTLILAATLLTACGEEENPNLTFMRAHAQYADAIKGDHIAYTKIRCTHPR